MPPPFPLSRSPQCEAARGFACVSYDEGALLIPMAWGNYKNVQIRITAKIGSPNQVFILVNANIFCSYTAQLRCFITSPYN